MLARPQTAGETFHQDFTALFEQAWRLAYPLARTLLEQRQKFAGIADDYTLGFFDLGIVRAIEDDAATDATARSFVNDMLQKLTALATMPGDAVLPGVFKSYSEALVYYLLKQRCGKRLWIEKIDDPDTSNPDFRCVLKVEDKLLEFFIEVKALNIATSPQRLPELTNESLDASIDLEGQLREGKKIATTTREVSPLQRAGTAKSYDPWSPRKLIEFLIEKACNNFKPSQFGRGPTFALANIIRLPVLDQGAHGLAPFFYDPLNGGACISGVLWHLAFGTLEAPMHRAPAFEGAGTLDGQLQRAGLLVDIANQLQTPGLVILHHEDGGYRLSGLYDPAWNDGVTGWSSNETEEVLALVCDVYNDRRNSMAHQLALRPELKAIKQTDRFC